MLKRSSLKQKLFDAITGANITNEQTEYDLNKSEPFSTNLDENVKRLKEILGTSQDVIFSPFEINYKKGKSVKSVLVAIDGLVDEEAKRNNVLKPLLEPAIQSRSDVTMQAIRERLTVKNIETTNDLIHAANQVVKKQALLLVDSLGEGLLISIEGFEIRAITEPDSEQVVRGSQEGFVESINVNLSLLRRRISHPALRFKTIEVGRYSKTNIAIAYVDGIACPKLVDRVVQKIEQIDVDMISSSGKVEQLIEEHPYSIFPTIGNTLRPDKAAALLMEGRVFILVDGDPVSLFVPAFFLETIKIFEDYSSRPYYTSLIRMLRLFAFIISISLPALYISAINFNKSLIPSDMIVPLLMARERVPFPLALEVILMILMFEVVREAGVRLPKQIGTAISIVGPLILGEVAVSSALVGAPTVIIVSISYIASFIVTPIADVTSVLRLVLFAASSVFGSYGLTVMLLAIFTHMVSLKTLGIPYMAPFSPLYWRDWKDSFIRFPTRLLRMRAKSIPNQRPKKIHSVPKREDKEL